MIKAIITGDIIHSTRMGEKSRDLLNKVMSQFLKYLNNEFGTKSEMYRGDSFQCLINKVQHALRIALLIKTKIRSLNPNEQKTSKRPAIVISSPMIYDARMAIGIGQVGKQVTRKLATSSGEAFVLSGHLLDKLKSTKQSLGIATTDKYKDELETEILLLDTILSKTTSYQCEVINLKLQNYSETEIARKLGIGQSAVNQRSNLGNWNAIQTMLERFESIYEK